MIPDSLIIQDHHLIHTCKYRQEGCCKYIVVFEHSPEFYCVKHFPEIRDKIEDKSSEMTAQGDNCEGLKYEARS